MRKLIKGSRRIQVAYWTAKDDREGACSPSGLTTLYVSEDYDADRINNLKRFKRRDGSSKIYDISEL